MGTKDEDVSVVIDGCRKTIKASQIEVFLNNGRRCVACFFENKRCHNECLRRIMEYGVECCWFQDCVINVDTEAGVALDAASMAQLCGDKDMTIPKRNRFKECVVSTYWFVRDLISIRDGIGIVLIVLIAGILNLCLWL